MGVKVIIAETFQTATAGTDIIEVQGETVGQCLIETVRKYPGLEKLWFEKKGKLAHYMLLFINGENVHGEGLGQKVKEGDEIYPMLIIGGG
jgi:molybdopterin converting factor small subunit